MTKTHFVACIFAFFVLCTVGTAETNTKAHISKFIKALEHDIKAAEEAQSRIVSQNFSVFHLIDDKMETKDFFDLYQEKNNDILPDLLTVITVRNNYNDDNNTECNDFIRFVDAMQDYIARGNSNDIFCNGLSVSVNTIKKDHIKEFDMINKTNKNIRMINQILSAGVFATFISQASNVINEVILRTFTEALFKNIPKFFYIDNQSDRVEESQVLRLFNEYFQKSIDMLLHDDTYRVLYDESCHCIKNTKLLIDIEKVVLIEKQMSTITQFEDNSGYKKYLASLLAAQIEILLPHIFEERVKEFVKFLQDKEHQKDFRNFLRLSFMMLPSKESPLNPAQDECSYICINTCKNLVPDHFRSTVYNVYNASGLVYFSQKAIAEFKNIKELEENRKFNMTSSTKIIFGGSFDTEKFYAVCQVLQNTPVFDRLSSSQFVYISNNTLLAAGVSNMQTDAHTKTNYARSDRYNRNLLNVDGIITSFFANDRSEQALLGASITEVDESKRRPIASDHTEKIHLNGKQKVHIKHLYNDEDFLKIGTDVRMRVGKYIDPSKNELLSVHEILLENGANSAENHVLYIVEHRCCTEYCEREMSIIHIPSSDQASLVVTINNNVLPYFLDKLKRQIQLFYLSQAGFTFTNFLSTDYSDMIYFKKDIQKGEVPGYTDLTEQNDIFSPTEQCSRSHVENLQLVDLVSHRSMPRDRLSKLKDVLANNSIQSSDFDHIVHNLILNDSSIHMLCNNAHFFDPFYDTLSLSVEAFVINDQKTMLKLYKTETMTSSMLISNDFALEVLTKLLNDTDNSEVASFFERNAWLKDSKATLIASIINDLIPVIYFGADVKAFELVVQKYTDQTPIILNAEQISVLDIHHLQNFGGIGLNVSNVLEIDLKSLKDDIRKLVTSIYAVFRAKMYQEKITMTKIEICKKEGISDPENPKRQKMSTTHLRYEDDILAVRVGESTNNIE